MSLASPSCAIRQYITPSLEPNTAGCHQRPGQPGATASHGSRTRHSRYSYELETKLLKPATTGDSFVIVVLHGNNREWWRARTEATEGTTATHPVSPLTQAASISTAVGRNALSVLEGASCLIFHMTATVASRVVPEVGPAPSRIPFSAPSTTWCHGWPVCHLGQASSAAEIVDLKCCR